MKEHTATAEASATKEDATKDRTATAYVAKAATSECRLYPVGAQLFC